MGSRLIGRPNTTNNREQQCRRRVHRTCQFIFFTVVAMQKVNSTCNCWFRRLTDASACPKTPQANTLFDRKKKKIQKYQTMGNTATEEAHRDLTCVNFPQNHAKNIQVKFMSSVPNAILTMKKPPTYPINTIHL